jgi:hypothetical protein
MIGVRMSSRPPGTLRDPSREAAKEYSPGRKPWVSARDKLSREGAKERLPHAVI